MMQLGANFLVYLLIAMISDKVSFSFLEKPEDSEIPPDNTAVVQLGKTCFSFILELIQI